MNSFASLHINGIYYNKIELLAFCAYKINETEISDWEKSIFNFIQIWLNKDDFIEVKTSGSVGQSKIIKLKKQHFVNSALLTKKALGIDNNMSALLCLSADFIAGRMMIVRAIVCKLKLIICEPGSRPLENIFEPIDFAAFVPLQIERSLKTNIEVGRLKAIKKIIIGGGSISVELINRIKTFGNDIYSTYGMTETCSHIAIKQISPITDTYYQCLQGINISLNRSNCLRISAPMLLDNELDTNDIAEIYKKNCFNIIGRSDFIINSGGIKINPINIEEKLKSIISQDFFISSIPDKQLGEKLILIIENGDNKLNTLFNLWKKLELLLPKYELPKIIDYYKPFIYTKSGKIDRKTITTFVYKNIKLK